MGKKSWPRATPVSDMDYLAIVAGLWGDPCPTGGNQFLHIEALYPDRQAVGWSRIVSVFRGLAHDERKEIIRTRRAGRERSRMRLAAIVGRHRA